MFVGRLYTAYEAQPYRATSPRLMAEMLGVSRARLSTFSLQQRWNLRSAWKSPNYTEQGE